MSDCFSTTATLGSGSDLEDNSEYGPRYFEPVSHFVMFDGELAEYYLEDFDENWADKDVPKDEPKRPIIPLRELSPFDKPAMTKAPNAEWLKRTRKATSVLNQRKLDAHSMRVELAKEMDMSKTKFYLLEELKPEVERLKVEDNLKRRREFASQYVTHDDPPLPDVSEVIKPGQHVECMGGWIESPGEFYVTPKQYWNLLEKFMRGMNTYYKRNKKEKMSIPSIKDCSLRKGLYIAVWKEFPDKTEFPEWHRAIIVRRMNDRTFKVRFIDYGDQALVDISKIRYLHKDYYQSMKAQAIRCMFHLGSYYDSEIRKGVQLNAGKGYQPNEKIFFLNWLFNRVFVVRFNEKKNIEDGFETWRVFIHLTRWITSKSPMIDWPAGPYIEKKHFERFVVHMCRGKYVHSSEDEDDDDFHFKFQLTQLPKIPRCYNSY